jgi:hypothetical protein
LFPFNTWLLWLKLTILHLKLIETLMFVLTFSS